MTCAEFRVLRDQLALETYRKRWPVLAAKAAALRAEIARIESTETPKAIEDSKRDKAGAWYQLQDTVSEIAQIEVDARIRKANLERETA